MYGAWGNVKDGNKVLKRYAEKIVPHMIKINRAGKADYTTEDVVEMFRGRGRLV